MRFSSTFTRQGALASARQIAGSTLAAPARTTFVLISGSVLIGSGVAAFRSADLGLPPYDVLLSSIASLTALSHGQAGWLLAAVLVTVAMGLGQRLLAGSVVLVFVNGLSVDAASAILGPASGLVTRTAVFGFGLVALSAGLALVVFSGKGRGPFEMLMIAGGERGFAEARIRTGLEVGVLAAGIATGGDFGVGTVVFALSIGPLLGSMMQALTDHRSGRVARLTPSAPLPT